MASGTKSSTSKADDKKSDDKDKPTEAEIAAAQAAGEQPASPATVPAPKPEAVMAPEPVAAAPAPVADATVSILPASGLKEGFGPVPPKMDHIETSGVSMDAGQVATEPGKPGELDKGETIIAKRKVDDQTIAVTSVGRKVVLDGKGHVAQRLLGPLYAWEPRPAIT